jgi:hypothetical protein
MARVHNSSSVAGQKKNTYKRMTEKIKKTNFGLAAQIKTFEGHICPHPVRWGSFINGVMPLFVTA